MTDKQHITIHIADAASLKLNINREEEEKVRKTVDNVNMLWSQWCNQYPELTTKDVLAMVAYQYARKFYTLLDSVKEKEAALTEAERALDKILLDVK